MIESRQFVRSIGFKNGCSNRLSGNLNQLSLNLMFESSDPQKMAGSHHKMVHQNNEQLQFLNRDFSIFRFS